MNTQNNKYLILFISVFLLINCKNYTQENKENEATQEKIIKNFDEILTCSDYTYNDGYFVTADYGCIYNSSEENDFGNLIIYLIPKNKSKLNNKQIDLDTKIVNNLNIDKYKKEFTIYIYFIDKKHLNYNKNGDPVYYQKEEYIEELYTYKANSKKWILLDSLKINSSSENSNEQRWRDNFINKIINYNSLTVFNLPKNYYVHDSSLINLKTKTYKIIALEKIENKDNKSNWYFGLPIVILEKNENEYSQIKKNENLVFKLDDNCPSDGYGGIVTKNNYFTIQQIFCQDFLFVNSYTTFKIDENTGNITLHKYGEEFTDRSNPDRIIPAKTWSNKDFGDIKFEDVTESFLDKLRFTKPKK